MNWINKNKKTIINTTFLVPIILVATISISHVNVWYNTANPLSWAMYLSIAIEVAALASLSALSVGFRKVVYFPFLLVTFIQILGNMFYCFQYINVSGHLFLSWKELIDPITQLMGIESTDLSSHRRILALLGGGLLPIISLSFMHMLVKHSAINDEKSPLDEIKEQLNHDDIKVNLPEPTPLPAVITNEDLLKLEQLLKIKEIEVTPTPIVSQDVSREAATVTHITNPEPQNTATVPETPMLTTPEVETLQEEVKEETGYKGPFTQVGDKLKKIQFDNTNRRI